MRKKAGLLKKYGALSALNQAIPFICKELLERYGDDHVSFCTGKETSYIRTSLGYDKTKEHPAHEIDAYCIGIAALPARDYKLPEFHTYSIKQFRRQNRAIVHHQTERIYYLGKIKVAANRRPRFEQSGDALSDWYEQQVLLYGKATADRLRSQLTAKKSNRAYHTKERLMPGTVFLYREQRCVMSGQLTGGRYLRAYGDTKTNYPTKDCKIVCQNEGLVFV